LYTGFYAKAAALCRRWLITYNERQVCRKAAVNKHYRRGDIFISSPV